MNETCNAFLAGQGEVVFVPSCACPVGSVKGSNPGRRLRRYNNFRNSLRILTKSFQLDFYDLAFFSPFNLWKQVVRKRRGRLISIKNETEIAAIYDLLWLIVLAGTFSQMSSTKASVKIVSSYWKHTAPQFPAKIPPFQVQRGEIQLKRQQCVIV